MSLDKVTLAEAAKSGKPFRYAGPLTPGASHYLTEGHLWRLYGGKYNDGREHRCPISKILLNEDFVICIDCDAKMGFRTDFPDLWILKKTDEELFNDAEKILNNIGLKIKKEETVK